METTRDVRHSAVAMVLKSHAGNLHERLVIAADLLNVNVVFGVDVRLQGAITLRVTAAQQASRILQLTVVLQAGGRTAAGLQDARELLPIELEGE